MRSLPAAFAMLLFITGGSAFSRCPANRLEWDEWRKRTVTELQQETTNWRQVLDGLDACKTSATDPSIETCLAPFRRMGEATLRLAGAGELSSAEWDAEQSQDRTFDVFSVPGSVEDLIVNFKRGNASPAIDKVLRQNPEVRILYRGDSLMILVPGEKSDVWFNVSPASILTMAIKKTDRNGKDLPRPLSFFRVYTLPTVRKTPSPHPELLDFGTTNALNCIRCHRTGGIAQEEVSDTEAKFHAVSRSQDVEKIRAFMNQRMEQTSNATPAGFDFADLGPAVGKEEEATRDTAFVKSCSGIEESESINRIQAAMDCARCHDTGKSQTILSGSLLRERYLDGIVGSGHMPPGAKKKLSPVERKALLTCLRQEYYGTPDRLGTIYRGLLETSCTQAPPRKREETPTTEKPDPQKSYRELIQPFIDFFTPAKTH